LAAQGELIFFLDADLSTPISEVTKLLAAMAEGADLAIGTRAALDSQIEIYQPRYRQVVGKIGNWLIRKLLSIPFLDTQCGFKIFKRSVAQQLFADLMFPGWSFDFEIVYKAYHSGLIIREVPVRWSHQVNSKFSPLFNSLACFLDLLYLRLILPQRKLIKP
jgi:dolichyl-phosphate beta-glucosyltransferase